MPMSPRLLRPLATSRPPLLDEFGNAEAAFSLRQLRSGYTGPAVRVRRSNDSAEADFTAAEIAGGQMLSWVGANTGTVVTWYDQTGNGRHFGQSTAGSQPTIVSSGSQVTLSGRPAISGDGSNDWLENTTWGRTSSETILVALQASTLGENYTLFSGNRDLGGFAQNVIRTDTTTTFNFATGGGNISVSGIATNTPYLLFASNGGSGTAVLGVNNATPTTGSVVAPTVNNGSDIFREAAGNPRGALGRYWQGRCAELVVFGTARPTEREKMLRAMNRHYRAF